MKSIAFLIAIKLFLLTDHNYAQQQNYTDLIKNGWEFCLKKEYTNAIKLYEEAFKLEKSIPIAEPLQPFLYLCHIGKFRQSLLPFIPHRY